MDGGGMQRRGKGTTAASSTWEMGCRGGGRCEGGWLQTEVIREIRAGTQTLRPDLLCLKRGNRAHLLPCLPLSSARRRGERGPPPAPLPRYTPTAAARPTPMDVRRGRAHPPSRRPLRAAPRPLRSPSLANASHQPPLADALWAPVEGGRTVLSGAAVGGGGARAPCFDAGCPVVGIDARAGGKGRGSSAGPPRRLSLLPPKGWMAGDSPDMQATHKAPAGDGGQRLSLRRHPVKL